MGKQNSSRVINNPSSVKKAVGASGANVGAKGFFRGRLGLLNNQRTLDNYVIRQPRPDSEPARVISPAALSGVGGVSSVTSSEASDSSANSSGIVQQVTTQQMGSTSIRHKPRTMFGGNMTLPQYFVSMFTLSSEDRQILPAREAKIFDDIVQKLLKNEMLNATDIEQVFALNNSPEVHRVRNMADVYTQLFRSGFMQQANMASVVTKPVVKKISCAMEQVDQSVQVQLATQSNNKENLENGVQTDANDTKVKTAKRRVRPVLVDKDAKKLTRATGRLFDKANEPTSERVSYMLNDKLRVVPMFPKK